MLNLNSPKFLKTQALVENAYAPYSKFKVVACVVLKNQQLFFGVNVENASYGLTSCAERNALFATYTAGYRKNDIEEIIILGPNVAPLAPCGACRQVIYELMEPEANVYLVGRTGLQKQLKVSELLPNAFREEDLNE